MGAITGIVAGAAAIVGAVAFIRYAERKTKNLRDSLKDAARAPDHSKGDQAGAVIEFEKDPLSGAYRQKQ